MKNVYYFGLGFLLHPDRSDDWENCDGIVVARDFEKAKRLFFLKARKDYYIQHLGLSKKLEVVEKKSKEGKNDFDLGSDKKYDRVKFDFIAQRIKIQNGFVIML